MMTPVTIKIVDHKDGYIRTIRGRHDQIAGWQLHGEPSAIGQTAARVVEFPGITSVFLPVSVLSFAVCRAQLSLLAFSPFDY
jgi:hypothetical protein